MMLSVAFLQTAQKARQVLAACEKSPTDAVQLNYDPLNPFDNCSITFTPIYRGNKCAYYVACCAAQLPTPILFVSVAVARSDLNHRLDGLVPPSQVCDGPIHRRTLPAVVRGPGQPSRRFRPHRRRCQRTGLQPDTAGPMRPRRLAAEGLAIHGAQHLSAHLAWLWTMSCLWD